MAKYTLTYFDTPGRAQVTRYLFAVAGVEFVDKRLNDEASWLAMKASTPLGQLPILDVAGRGRICQSSCIERFVAKECGLYGSTDADVLLVDQIHTTISEAGDLITPYFFGDVVEDEEAREVLRLLLVQHKLPVYFDFLNCTLLANGGGDGYLVGSKLTLADVYWGSAFQYAKSLDQDGEWSVKYPKLYALADRILALPAIVEFNKLTDNTGDQ